jgi:beta-phosphoglucomutase-like phosphatase (HAD superfamily)
VDTTRSIAIEDSGLGIAAAETACMKAVAIPHRLTERHDVRAAELSVTLAAEVRLDRLRALLE